MTNQYIAHQLGEALKVLSGPSHSVYKVSKVGEILDGLRRDLDGCKPEPCDPEPDCRDDDDCYEDCDDGYVWIYVPNGYEITLTPCE